MLKKRLFGTMTLIVTVMLAYILYGCNDGNLTDNTSNTGNTDNTGNTGNTGNNGNTGNTGNTDTLYTVTFDTSDTIEIFGTAPVPQTVTAGSSITLPDVSDLTKFDYISAYHDYAFIGWNTNDSGTGTNYNAGSSYTVTGNITLYAQWELIIVPFVVGTYYYGTSSSTYITFNSDGTYTYYYISLSGPVFGPVTRDGTYTLSGNDISASGFDELFTIVDTSSSDYYLARLAGNSSGFLWVMRQQN